MELEICEQCDGQRASKWTDFRIPCTNCGGTGETEKEYTIEEHPCAICRLLVYASNRTETWGIEYGKSWFHYDCIRKLYLAMLRIKRAEKMEFEKKEDDDAS